MLKSINIDSELHKKIKIMSAESGATMTALIEEGLNHILGRTPYNEKVSLKSAKSEIKPLIPIEERAEGLETVSSDPPRQREVKLNPDNYI